MDRTFGHLCGSGWVMSPRMQVPRAAWAVTRRVEVQGWMGFMDKAQRGEVQPVSLTPQHRNHGLQRGLPPPTRLPGRGPQSVRGGPVSSALRSCLLEDAQGSGSLGCWSPRHTSDHSARPAGQEGSHAQSNSRVIMFQLGKKTKQACPQVSQG